MTNMREMLGFTDPYWKINREERNYAALLYYALLSGNNLGKFLHSFAPELPLIEDQHAAYVEYAYIRDLWEATHASNEVKRTLITGLLATGDVGQLQGASVLEWNQHFGVSTPFPSSKVIQSPSQWSMDKYNENIASKEDFLATCKFKWSFNIKPDLVIHTSNEHAVVIETKYASREGSYPAKPSEKAIFANRGLHTVGQTELQEYMFRHLLGVEGVYLYVVQNPVVKSETHHTVLWSDIFHVLDVTQVPPFVREWLAALAGQG
jgi:hypothetical protein